ncbi:MAG: hypothetical protein NTY19_41005 [Planctomycetota bacterium]|nr:hypothetical protein [Planctomycetota bacterium]
MSANTQRTPNPWLLTRVRYDGRQSCRQESLDYFVVFGERHLNHLVHEIVAYYHEARPHQVKDNDLLVPAADAKKAEERASCVSRTSAVESGWAGY